jgi:DNA-binding MarR family transcriptional regulator/GNAT superfamily N-acetyltransferase
MPSGRNGGTHRRAQQSVEPALLEEVRRFTRSVAKCAVVLDDAFLSRSRPLGHARLLWEIGDAGPKEGADVRALRSRLGLDSGYLSRMLRALEADGLVTVVKSRSDGRVRTVQLTEKGRRERAELDRLSDESALSILEPLTDMQRRKLTDSMAMVRALIEASSVVVSERDPRHRDSRACVRAYFDELASRFDAGFDEGRAIPALDSEMSPPEGTFLLATLRGEPIGCCGLKFKDSGIAEMKRMWVARSARGMGLGRRLLVEIEKLSIAAGARTLRLDTNRALTEAIAMYRSSGFVEVEAFNDEPHADHWFEKTLARSG